ncbi:FAD/NAD(P)-binding oxidoreductase [Comamonas sp. JC664]|uniref:NAD(P)/FAD-dependent oxidoreductase n=1 Tax=Comamonas sp. JC664 TaxID=2801917 RepID=UPI00191E6E32|nr:FAD/NAD(P)-binding oxidoreductase [Comamonas sp. JC664]MBL0698316.1 NAD(P)/FAD-dependent oxidoreductase [Comamonas sp. JC664]GHG89541.1 pyridine nucleotide-disulfide oxidoreductase [Comamonas sp. KCTC 72670]
MQTSEDLGLEDSVTPSSPVVMPVREHHRVLIIGGGTAGIAVAARLARAGQKGVAVLEPSQHHYYQPLWTLVGAGEARIEDTVRNQSRLIPRGVRWVRDAATEVDPEAREVRTRGGLRLGYDFLVVAPGIQLDWDKVTGLREALKTPHVSSNYDVQFAPKTWRLIQGFKGGTALFTQPSTPVKCAGAPQKIMYLAADHFRRVGVLERTSVVFGSGAKAIFGVRPFASVLEGVVHRYGITPRFQHNLVSVDGDKREATFESTRDGPPERLTLAYDMLHVTPPQSAPDFIKRSPLAWQTGPNTGWVKADKYTLQHPDHPNVFALGDASDLPTSRTGAAVRKQAPVLVENLLACMRDRPLPSRYNGYASCPLTTGYGRLLLAEFDYDGQPAPTIPFIDTFKERGDLWLLKKHGLPFFYWAFMMRGLA